MLRRQVGVKNPHTKRRYGSDNTNSVSTMNTPETCWRGMEFDITITTTSTTTVTPDNGGSRSGRCGGVRR